MMARITDKEAKSKRAKRSRNKGKRFERETVNIIQQHLPEGYSVKRGFQSRGGGKEEPDVGVWDPSDKLLLHHECKDSDVSIQAAYRQACRDVQEHVIPVAVCKKDGVRLVVLRIEDYARLLGLRLEAFQEELEDG